MNPATKHWLPAGFPGDNPNLTVYCGRNAAAVEWTRDRKAATCPTCKRY